MMLIRNAELLLSCFVDGEAELRAGNVALCRCECNAKVYVM